MVDKESQSVVPLTNARFKVEIQDGYADLTLHQLYENNSDHPLETLFMMPYSDTFSLTKIEVDFKLPDGTTASIETRVTEREAAKIQYSDAIASGQTAVMSYTESSSTSKPMLRVILGNFPAHSKAYLRA